jgi:transcriptional/translational regulatory protein YebC/TACO1
VSSDEEHEFIASLEDFGAVRDALEAKLGEPRSAKLEWRGQTSTPVADDAGETLIKLLDTLDEHDDVQNVYGNYELSDALLERLSG